MVKNISCKNDWLKLIADKTTDFTFFGKRYLNGDYRCCIGTQNTKTVKHQSTAIGTAICTKTHSKEMVKRNKTASSSKRETDKAKYHQEKVDMVKAILASMENDTQTFWKPTFEEMEQIGLGGDDDDCPAVSEETLDELEEQLSRIYHVVPHAICYAHSNAFLNSNPDLAKKVREVFGDRYETLRMQHSVAYRLLRLRYPVLYRVAEHNKFLKSLEWNQMRTRLTQSEQNTDDKTWLDRMYELLNNKVIKELKGRYRKNEDGDLELSNEEDEFDYGETDSSEDDDTVTVTGSKTPSKKEVTDPKTTGGKAPRKRVPESELTPFSAAKKPKHDQIGDNDTKNGDEIGDLTDSALLSKIEELTSRQCSSSDRRSQIKLLIGAVTDALAAIDNQCDSLQGYTDSAVSSMVSLNEHRIKAENGKKKFHDDFRQVYRALHREYMRVRKLLYSHAWWVCGFHKSANTKRLAALELYYDQTHPFCHVDGREGLPSIITPVQPSTTIADTALLSKEETDKQMNALYHLSDGDDITGMSLLQMSPEVQSHITDIGQWPENGIGGTSVLSKELIGEIMDYRNSFYKMYKIDDKLLEANVHMVKCSNCSPSEPVPNVPLEAHSVPSSAETNTGVVNTGDGSGTSEANGSTENGSSSTIPEETTEATV